MRSAIVNGVQKVLGLRPSICIPRFSISARLGFTNDLPQSLSSKQGAKDVDVLFAHDFALIGGLPRPRQAGLCDTLPPIHQCLASGHEVAAPVCGFNLGDHSPLLRF